MKERMLRRKLSELFTNDDDLDRTFEIVRAQLMNTETIDIAPGLPVEVVRKRIVNLHVGVYPPDGRVRVAAPIALSNDAVRIAVLTRFPWIKKQKLAFLSQERESVRAYADHSVHLRALQPGAPSQSGQRAGVRVALGFNEPKGTVLKTTKAPVGALFYWSE